MTLRGKRYMDTGIKQETASQLSLFPFRLSIRSPSDWHLQRVKMPGAGD